MDQIFEWVDIRSKRNLTKIGAPKWGVPPKRGPLKLKLFNLLSWTHEIFEVSEYNKGKI